MKKLGTENIQRIANFMFPDDGTLALFNLVADVSSGTMAYEVIDGPPEVASAEDTEIAVVMGLGTVGHHPCRISWIFLQEHADQADVLTHLVRNLRPQPQDPIRFDLERPPYTMAALVACAGSDGRLAYALFRHPSLDHQQAIVILADTFPDEDAAAPPAKPN